MAWLGLALGGLMWWMGGDGLGWMDGWGADVVGALGFQAF
jgi:hypothetical protein